MSLTVRKGLPILGALGVLGPMGNDIFLPAMPIMAVWLLTSPASIQFALGAMSIGMAVGQLAVGIIADRVGRRIPMILGATLATLSAFSAAAAPNVTILVWASFFLGLGAASGMVVGRAVISDISTGAEARKAYAILGSLTGIGPIVGPLLGTLLLALWGWQATFIALGIMAAAVTVAVILNIPETLPQKQRHTISLREYPKMMWGILRTPTYIVNASFIWVGFAMVFGYISASSFVVQEILGWGPATYSVIFAVNGGSMAAIGMLTGILSHRYNARTMIRTAVVLQSVGAVLFVIILITGLNSALFILPAMWCVAVSMGFIFGPATGNAMADVQGKSGTALALMGAIQFIFGGIAAPWVGICGESSIAPLSILVITGTSVTILVFTLGRRFS